MAICGLVWEIAIQIGILHYQYLPAPSAIVLGAGELAASGELVAATLHTLESVFLGWAIAVAAGVSFGLLLGSSPLLRRYSLATIEVLRPMPAIAQASAIESPSRTEFRTSSSIAFSIVRAMNRRHNVDGWDYAGKAG